MTLIRRRNGLRGHATSGVQLLAVTLCLCMLRSSASAMPGDIVTSPAPTLGADPPAGTKVETGDAKVSPQTGSLQYSYPISVPPGRGGAQPSLSLQYSSQGALYGGVAAGWTLGGLPEIRRDYSNGFEAFDKPDFYGTKVAPNPRWLSTMAGGRELIQVDESYGPEMMASYRAQSDSSFTRYQKVGLSPEGAYSWVALTTDGSRYEFGFGDDPLGDAFPDWAPLTRFVDQFGNTVVYEWEQVSRFVGQTETIADLRLARIYYSENNNAGLVAHAKVELTYASQPFPCSNSAVGAQLTYDNDIPRWKGASKLTAFTTFVRATRFGSWTTVRQFDLGYDSTAELCPNPNHTPNRLLTSITERDSTGVQLRPEMTFTYGALTRSLSGSLSINYDTSIVANESIGYGSRVTVNPITSSMLLSKLIDLDGDSRVDRLRGSGTNGALMCTLDWNKNQVSTSYETACLGTCDIKFESPQTSTTGGAIAGVPPMPWADATGVLTGSLDATLKEHCSLTGQFSMITNKQPEQGCIDINLGHFKFYRYLDMNSDGIPDLVTALHYDAKYYDPALPPSASAPPPAPPSGEGAGCSVPDEACLADAILCTSSGCVYDHDEVQECIKGAPVLPCFDVAADVEPIYRLNTGNGPTSEGLGVPIGLPVPPSSGCLPERKPEAAPNGRYKWVIYWGLGDGTFDVGPGNAFVVSAPIPLASHSGDMGPRANRFSVASETHALIDLDGDGHIDAVHIPKNAYITYWLFYRGDGTGNFHANENGAPMLWTVPQGARPRSQTEVEDPTVVETTQQSAMFDVNGDGRPDFVWQHGPGQAPAVHYNTGTGFSHTKYSLVLPNPTVSRASINAAILTGTPSLHSTLVRSVDFDGDGRPDFQLDTGGPVPDVYWNMTTGLSTAQPTAAAAGFQEQTQVTATDWTTMSTAIDLNGDGITDAVNRVGIDAFPTVATDVNNGQRRALLQTINNHRGMTVDVQYTSHNDKTAVVEIGSGRLPQPTWVVSSLTRTDAYNDTGSALEQWAYKYIEPVWNQDHNDKYGFRGFKSVETTSPSGALTVQDFDYTVDWSGRGIRASVYADASQTDQPHTISTTSWVPRFLFAADPYPDTLETFHTWETTLRTCSTGQTTAQCQSSGVLLRTTTIWSTQPTGTTDVLHVAASTTRSSNATEWIGDRRASNLYDVYYDANNYRLRTTDETRDELTGPTTWTTFGRTTRTFDPNGLVEVVSNVWRNGSTMNSTKREYDMNTGNVTGRVKPEQFLNGGFTPPRETYAYDTEYRLFVVTTTNELGHVVENDYDLATGVRIATRGPNEKMGVKEQVRVVIDALGRPTEKWVTVDDVNSWDPYVEKLVERTTYSDFATPAQIRTEKRIDYDGTVWVTADMEVDGHGRPHSVSTITGGPQPAVNDYVYDVSGNVVSFRTPDPSNDADQVEYKYTYDRLSRPLTFRDPLGNGVNVLWNALVQRVRECEGDGGGGCVEGGSTAAEKELTKDVFGRLQLVKERTSAGTWATTDYAYDANNNVRWVNSADGHVTVLTHDWTSKRLSIDKFGKTWSYTYDRNGNLSSELLPRPYGAPEIDYTKTFVYDNLDRETSNLTPSMGMSSSQQTELAVGMTWSYYDGYNNGIGRLWSVYHPNSILSLSYEYDGRGNKARESVNFYLGSSLPGAWSFYDTRVREYTYNALGQVVDTQHGDGDYFSPSTHTTVGYNVRGRPLTVDWNLEGGGTTTLATYTRSVAGSVVTRTSPNSDRTFVYDTLGRVTSDKAVDAGGGVQFWHTLVYGKTGEVESTVSKVANTATRAFAFSYGRQHQLKTAVDDQAYSASFGYSDGGRVMSANVAVPSGARAALNRNVNYEYNWDWNLEAPDVLVDASSGAIVRHYYYDERGNVTTAYGASESISLLTDGNNDHRIASSGVESEIYYYAGPGRRMLAVRRDSAGAIDRVRFWLGGTEIWYTATGSVDKTWAHVNLGSPIARIENRATMEFSHHNMLGSLIVSLDDNGVATTGFQYGPFGEVLEKTGDTANHLRQFNGKEADAVSKLNYYGYRYYDPVSLTWTQSDPLYRFAPDAALAEPRRMNLYGFSLNNPISNVDPDGLDPLDGYQGGSGCGRYTQRTDCMHKRQYGGQSPYGRTLTGNGGSTRSVSDNTLAYQRMHVLLGPGVYLDNGPARSVPGQRKPRYKATGRRSGTEGYAAFFSTFLAPLFSSKLGMALALQYQGATKGRMAIFWSNTNQLRNQSLRPPPARDSFMFLNEKDSSALKIPGVNKRPDLLFVHELIHIIAPLASEVKVRQVEHRYRKEQGIDARNIYNDPYH